MSIVYSLVCHLTLQSRKIPIKGSSIYDSSGAESDHVENDESDEVSGYVDTVV